MSTESISAVALALSIVGALTATLSLGWQIASWSLDGRRVRVRLLHGAAGPTGHATGPVGRDRRPNDLSSLRVEGFQSQEVIGIAVTNVGRAPVRVDRYGVSLVRGGVSFFPMGDAIGPGLPHRLPPGETEVWLANAQDARALIIAARAAGQRVSRDVRMEVHLGTGDVKRTNRTITFG